ncbi:MAG: hypothetical protein GY730_03560, partial [bacterium]|nr:hypothetical protein [bacterium]
ADRSFARDDGDDDLVLISINKWFDNFQERLRDIFESPGLDLVFDRKNYNFQLIKAVKQKAQSESEIERPDKEQIKEKRKSLFNTLASMKKKLGSSASPELYDMKLDIDIIRLELQKISPDRDIIKQKMMRLDYNNRIINEINTLYHSLNI